MHMARRRSLAAPFVVTVAAACHRGAEAPVSHDPPELATPATPELAATSAASASPSAAPTVVALPTAAPSARPASTSPQTWLIKQKDAQCTSEILPDCSKFPCTSSTPKPYPCPPAPEFPATVRRWSGQVVCTVQTTPTMHCPLTATCNPPPADYARVPCPE